MIEQRIFEMDLIIRLQRYLIRKLDKELRDIGSQNLEVNPSSVMANGGNGNEHPERSGTNL